MKARNTVQRQLVLEAVQKLHHPTAEDVYGMIIKDHSNVSRATVYRNLNLLADAGQIRRVQLLDAAIRFDGSLTDHYHAQCRSCGKVLDVMGETCLGSLGDALKEQGFDVETKEVLLRGLCADCKRHVMETGRHSNAFQGENP